MCRQRSHTIEKAEEPSQKSRQFLHVACIVKAFFHETCKIQPGKIQNILRTFAKVYAIGKFWLSLEKVGNFSTNTRVIRLDNN